MYPDNSLELYPIMLRIVSCYAPWSSCGRRECRGNYEMSPRAPIPENCRRRQIFHISQHEKVGIIIQLNSDCISNLHVSCKIISHHLTTFFVKFNQSVKNRGQINFLGETFECSWKSFLDLWVGVVLYP